MFQLPIRMTVGALLLSSFLSYGSAILSPPSAIQAEEPVSEALQLASEFHQLSEYPGFTFNGLDYSQAHNAIQKGLWNRALKISTQAINRGSRDPKVLGVFTLCGAVMGSEEIENQVLPELSAIENPPYYSELSRTVIELREGNFSSAEERLQSIRERAPSDPIPLYFQGKLLQLQERRAAAIKTYTETLKIEPNFAPALAAKARLLSTDKKDEALLLMERALHIHPENTSYQRHLATLYMESGQTDKAHPLYKALLKAVPGVRESYLAGAWQLMQSGNSQEALNKVESYLEYWPPHSLIYLIQAMARIDLGQSAAADQALQHYLAHSNHSIQARTSAALCMLAQGQLKTANDLFKSISEQQPANQQVLINLALLAQLNNNYPHARALVKQAHVAGEREPLIAYLRANLFLGEGNIAKYEKLLAGQGNLFFETQPQQKQISSLVVEQRKQLAEEHNLMLIMFLNKWYSQVIKLADLSLQKLPQDSVALSFRNLALQAQQGTSSKSP